MGEKLANLWGRQREEPLSWELERERWATADHGLRASLGEALLHATGPLGRPSLRPLHPNIWAAQPVRDAGEGLRDPVASLDACGARCDVVHPGPALQTPTTFQVFLDPLKFR